MNNYNVPEAIRMYPYSVNVAYREGADASLKIRTEVFANKRDALSFAREEVKWEGTVRVTVTDDRNLCSGHELFDKPGDFV